MKHVLPQQPHVICLYKNACTLITCENFYMSKVIIIGIGEANDVTLILQADFRQIATEPRKLDFL